MLLLPATGALTEEEGAGGDMAGILDLYFHADHPEKILFAGPAYHHWVTSDFGRTFTKVCLHRIVGGPWSP